ncbi:conserved hypothetical protein [Leishmania major strain Friedlin]|uniref:Transmembrane protein n=1 Tax=Leishmania major TaxID=5664 RepID=Q4QB16_LEIMA|nr:conserved hypothetical protein [Leishmania major strain Friedlin]CAG9574390.1 hypothetical_protein_-_conserved [Leishmania major strain Friedlin]CAJ04901.1 conserved hypothetical protein [Leishmania major strain Friedlin]|eukprot:XP_001683482.1 conserved hypothetical protein [Leishmania major strain Friedlin]
MTRRASVIAPLSSTCALLSTTAPAGAPSLPTSFSAPLHTAQRHKSFAATIQDMTIMRMGSSYKPGMYSSKDISSGPRAGIGHDPVFASFLLKKIVGPLRRKQSNSPEDFLNVDEAGKWMDAKNAAKVLGIKEEELPRLTKTTLEDAFRKEYKGRTNAHQEEVVIATEVLLEYLDSSVYVKKSRQYYRKFLENARHEVDAELTREQRERNESLIWWFGIAITCACAVVFFVAYSRKYVTRSDVASIGTKTAEYFVMTFLQPKNTEPKPDYNTRYFNTPTSMELDKKNGRYAKQFLSTEEIRQAERSAAYEEQEEVEMLKLFNDERERSVRDRQDDKARESRVSVYLPEKVEEAEQPAQSRDSSDKTAFEKLTFQEFSSMLASNFGGGSRCQRLTEETSSRTERLNAARERIKSASS